MRHGTSGPSRTTPSAAPRSLLTASDVLRTWTERRAFAPPTIAGVCGRPMLLCRRVNGDVDHRLIHGQSKRGGGAHYRRCGHGVQRTCPAGEPSGAAAKDIDLQSVTGMMPSGGHCAPAGAGDTKGYTAYASVGPRPLGLALASLIRLARGLGDRQTGEGHRLPTPEVPRVLDQAESVGEPRSAVCARRGPRCHPAHVVGQRARSRGGPSSGTTSGRS